MLGSVRPSRVLTTLAALVLTGAAAWGDAPENASGHAPDGAAGDAPRRVVSVKSASWANRDTETSWPGAASASAS